jgi:hypothetical protein
LEVAAWMGRLKRGVANEHDFAGDAAYTEQLMRFPRFDERKLLSDQRLDFMLLEQFEQGGQILPE